MRKLALHNRYIMNLRELYLYLEEVPVPCVGLALGSAEGAETEVSTGQRHLSSLGSAVRPANYIVKVVSCARNTYKNKATMESLFLMSACRVYTKDSPTFFLVFGSNCIA